MRLPPLAARLRTSPSLTGSSALKEDNGCCRSRSLSREVHSRTSAGDDGRHRSGSQFSHYLRQRARTVEVPMEGRQLRYLKEALSLMGRQRNARVLQIC